MEPEKLTSWKEIANFLNVDAKTAQRWERLRGLPIRRIPGGGRGSVYALPSEIEQWLKSAGDEASEAGRDPAPRPAARSLLAGLKRWLVPLAIVTISAVVLLVAWRGRGEEIASAAVRGRMLTAFDKMGNSLWAYELSPAARALEPHNGWSHALRTVRWRQGDKPELVAAFVTDDNTSLSSHVLCLDASGRKRWQWDATFPLLDFNGRPFERQWILQHILPDSTSPDTVVWAAVANPVRWASGLFRLDSEGRADLRFANAGSIQRVLRLPPAAGSKLLIAGVNNAFSRAFVAEIDPNGPVAFSPPSGNDRYHLFDTPAGRPVSYYLLPESEIHHAGNLGYFHVDKLLQLNDRVVVEVIAHPTGQSAFLYEFDLNLTPVRARLTASGHGLHQAYEAKGLIGHRISECPEMNGRQVLRKWTQAEGWREVQIPVANATNLQ